jgi:phenol 2-monooxygenase
MIVVRPDQYIAHILPLYAYTELATFFDGFMTQKVEHVTIGAAVK